MATVLDLPPELVARIVLELGRTGAYDYAEEIFPLGMLVRSARALQDSCMYFSLMRFGVRERTIVDEAWRCYREGLWNTDGLCECTDFERCKECYYAEHAWDESIWASGWDFEYAS